MCKKNKLYVLEGTISSPKDNYASPMMNYNPLLSTGWPNKKGNHQIFVVF